MNTEIPLVEFRNASIWRGRTHVFRNLNLAFGQHERIAILGPNGSGKTTLLKTINREIYPVVQPDSWVRILGRERWNVWELRRRIGVVSHDLQVRYTLHTTALEVVVSGFQSSIGVHGTLATLVRPEHTERAAATLKALGVGDLQHTRLAAMSTGQQRRCLLARALVHEPDMLILDEPTAGLDISAAFDYLRLIRKLAGSGQNIVIVTHHLNEIPLDVERVILLKAGAIFADGSKHEILSSENLSQLYETPVRVTSVDGYYLAYPG